jgi:hypothetical protein
MFKRLILTAILVLSMVLPVTAAQNKIITNNIFSAEAISASASATSLAIPLDSFKLEGFFSLQVTVAGSGTAKFTYQLSNDGVTYAVPSDAAGTAVDDIVTALTAGSTIHSFSPPMAKYMKIICTETGGANSVTVTAWLGVQ